MQSNSILEALEQAVAQRNKLSAELAKCGGHIAELIAQAVTENVAIDPVLQDLKPLIPRQSAARPVDNTSTHTPTPAAPKKAAPSATPRSRAWEVIQGADMGHGMTADELLGRLQSEGYADLRVATVQGWLSYWNGVGSLRRVPGAVFPTYVPNSKGTFHSLTGKLAPTPSGNDPVPPLLREAQLAVQEAGGRMHSGELAASFNVNPYELGTQLSGLLRRVGIRRPAEGKVRSGPRGQLAPGFTEECLNQAIAIFEASGGAGSSPG
ncbi:hypothetical protein [Streptomyces cavernicola]|uniref:Uncharacterized protein n=1 Tax=Streptomyces cavernicola TaxID=3043613 RepID=A0ABT6S443_9ACTN|nr:hypothetical protein [Streptomyces sp. B-S-A6]MDI3402869.1 hypothetical protein [Streptomyces sp. B-S-A6]